MKPQDRAARTRAMTQRGAMRTLGVLSNSVTGRSFPVTIEMPIGPTTQRFVWHSGRFGKLTIHVEFDDEEMRWMVDRDAVLQSAGLLRLRIDYPLSEPRQVEIEMPPGLNGWTRLHFAHAVRGAYRQIYASAREFRVWGHGIGELFLEGATQAEDGSWQLHIGS